jgi:hypothetical protein
VLYRTTAHFVRLEGIKTQTEMRQDMARKAEELRHLQAASASVGAQEIANLR